ncbi:MAG: YciI family protein [Bacteroidota bacterium]
MNTFYLPILLLALFSCSFPPQPKERELNAQHEEPLGYDPDLATRLKADEYGMGQYVMAFLKRGPNRDLDSLEAVELQRAHMENIGKLAQAGKLLLAGPFMDDGDLRGIYIFDVKTVEEAQALTETDPAIQAGSLVMELHPWYGSAAVREINSLHTRISKANP